MSNVLENYAFYVSETISNKELNKHNFISVDNMLPNGEGIKEADYVPTEGTSIKFRRNDILIGNIRPYFKKIWMAEFDGGCSADVLCIRAKDSISPEYLLFYLLQDSFFDYVMSGSKGTRMPRGDKDHIMNFPVLEQANGKSIGEIFLNLYKKIQNNKKQIETLETIAKIIYDYWFMQLDFPNEKGKPYKSSGGKMVWKRSYVPTPSAENIFQEFQTCPEGKVINPLTGNCIKETATTNLICPEGKYLNILTGRCKTIETKKSTTCKDGYYLNPLTGRCKKKTSAKTLTECKEGYERNPETNRCRKIAKNSGDEYKIKPIKETEYDNPQIFVATGAIIGLVILAVVCVCFQFRKEIKKRIMRLCHRRKS